MKLINSSLDTSSIDSITLKKKEASILMLDLNKDRTDKFFDIFLKDFKILDKNLNIGRSLRNENLLFPELTFLQNLNFFCNSNAINNEYFFNDETFQFFFKDILNFQAKSCSPEQRAQFSLFCYLAIPRDIYFLEIGLYPIIESTFNNFFLERFEEIKKKALIFHYAWPNRFNLLEDLFDLIYVYKDNKILFSSKQEVNNKDFPGL